MAVAAWIGGGSSSSGNGGQGGEQVAGIALNVKGIIIAESWYKCEKPHGQRLGCRGLPIVFKHM